MLKADSGGRDRTESIPEKAKHSYAVSWYSALWLAPRGGSRKCTFQVFLLASYSSPVSLNHCFLRLKTALAKRTGRPVALMEGPEEGLGRRRSSRIMEETSGIEEDEEETMAAVHSRRGRRDGEVQTQGKGKQVLESTRFWIC